MAMHQLPTVSLAAIDAGDPERDLTEIVLPADLGLEAFDLDGVGDVGADDLDHGFERRSAPVSVVGRRTLELLVHRRPPPAEPTERVAEGDVVVVRQQL